MKKLFILIFLLFFLKVIVSGQNDSILYLIPTWEKNDIRKYEIIDSALINDIGKRLNYSIKKQFTIKVLDIKNSIIGLLWTYDKVIYTDYTKNGDPFFDLLFNLYKNVAIKYTANSKGNIISILNYDEITAVVKSNFNDAIQKIMNEKKVDSLQIDISVQAIKGIFSTNRGINMSFLNELFLFHQIYGNLYKINKTTSIIDTISFINHEPADRLNITLLALDKKNNYWEFNVEKYSPYMEQLNAILKMNYDVIEKINYKYQYPENWLFKYTSIRTIRGDNPGYFNYSIKLLE